MNDRQPLEFGYRLEQPCYEAIDDAFQELKGVDLKSFALENPRETYLMLQYMCGAIAKAADAVDINGIEVSKEMDGEQAMQGSVEAGIKEHTVDTDIESVEVTVSVYDKQTFRDRLVGRRAVSEMVKFRVDPPSLAF